MRRTALLALAALAAATAAPTFAQTTLPDDNPELQGRTPFRNITNSANGGESGSRAQVVYGADFFAGTQSITGFSLRAANGPAPFLGNDINFENVIIRLSTTQFDDTAGNRLSTTFADNIGGDAMTVFSGALMLSTSASVSGTDRPFDFTVDFTDAFTFDPTMGNLLLDVFIPVGTSVTSNGIFGSRTFAIDSGVNDGAATVFASMNFGQNGNSQIGTFADFAPTIRFASNGVSAVPEPATWAFMIVGFGAVGASLRSARRKQPATVTA